jgi:hypothetical protein
MAERHQFWLITQITREMPFYEGIAFTKTDRMDDDTLRRHVESLFDRLPDDEQDRVQEIYNSPEIQEFLQEIAS